MRVFIINGKPRSGKDTFCDFCAEIIGTHYVKSVSFADAAKDIATNVGWDGQKDDKSRKFLADLTDLLTDYNDFPFNKIIKNVLFYKEYYGMYDVGDKAIVFICAREPAVIDKLKKEFAKHNIDAKSIIIRNDRTENIPGTNRADCSVFQGEYDITIYNNGTLAELHDKAREFCKKFSEA